MRLICYIIKSRVREKEERPQAQIILRIRRVASAAVDRTHLFGFTERVFTFVWIYSAVVAALIVVVAVVVFRLSVSGLVNN